MEEDIINILYGDRKDYKGTKLIRNLLQNNLEFRNIILEGIKNNKITGFSEELWTMIDNQNIRGINSFLDVFVDGANIGYCTVASKQLSYSFDSCFIAGGVNKYLVNSTNSIDGSHTWIVRNNKIYDTTFMLEIDRSFEGKLGYIEENRYDPNLDRIYKAAKEFTNDKELSIKK